MTKENWALGVDVSRWQEQVDWNLLFANGVRFVFVKCSQGDQVVDSAFHDHVMAASSSGLIVGAYHWCDPTRPAHDQAEFALSAVHGLPVDMLALDVEQHWQDWSEWRQGRITHMIPPQAISQCAQQIACHWRRESKVPVIIYTRASFIYTFAAPASAWLAEYPLWLAHYPYNSTRVHTTWHSMIENYAPGLSGPALPKGCHGWQFWQFSGDKFHLPGVKGAIDLNYFNGSEAELHAFVDRQQVAATAVTLEERLLRLEEAARLRGWML